MGLTVSAACLSAKARASSPVFHSLFQLGLRGAPTNACMPGLMSAVGAGSAFAGTSRGARSVAIATAGVDSNAPQAIVLKSFMAVSSSVWVPHRNERRLARLGDAAGIGHARVRNEFAHTA